MLALKSLKMIWQRSYFFNQYINKCLESTLNVSKNRLFLNGLFLYGLFLYGLFFVKNELFLYGRYL